MKKLILLGLATMITFSASAQIDGFDDSELVTTKLNSELKSMLRKFLKHIGFETFLFSLAQLEKM